ncbi:MAG TPA: sialidase, partial [Porphyromonadaceae bacterium]|nr:sialidase [Porphyromonadaceae bacterium]
MGNYRAWHNSQAGMDEKRTGQLILTKSMDDGKTWSDPINITSQVKDPSWHLLLQGPGRGITMQDGTLVFPIQFIDSTRIP